jgi:hypothetical protein
VGISTEKGIIIVDPTNVANSQVTIVPDLKEVYTNQAMSALKSRLEDAKSLGLVRVCPTELLVVYDVLGCFITNHGIPSRSSGYIKWETKATSFAQRGGHVLLFSEQFIEIRNIATGVIVQVIEGTDIRLLHASPSYGDDDTVLIAMRGDKMDKDGTSDKIIELVETTEYGVTSPTIQTTPSTAIPAMWDEWDM